MSKVENRRPVKAVKPVEVTINGKTFKAYYDMRVALMMEEEFGFTPLGLEDEEKSAEFVAKIMLATNQIKFYLELLKHEKEVTEQWLMDNLDPTKFLDMLNLVNEVYSRGNEATEGGSGNEGSKGK